MDVVSTMEYRPVNTVLLSFVDTDDDVAGRFTSEDEEVFLLLLLFD